jgi:arylsulfatase A-like enzyme
MSHDYKEPRARAWWRKALDRSIIFGIVGLLDVLLTAVVGGVGTEAFETTALVVSLWVFLGLVLTAIEQGLWTVLFGVGGEGKIAHGLHRRWHVCKTDAGYPADRKRVAVLLTTVAVLLVFLAVSGFWLRYLIMYRHGTLLIVLAFLLGQCILMGLSALLYAGLFPRFHRRLLRLQVDGFAARVLSLPFILRSVIGLAVGALLVLVTFQLDLIIAIDGFAFLLVGLALVLRPFGQRFFPDGRKRLTDIVVWPMFILATMHLASAPENVRRVTVSDTMTAKYVYATIQKMADFDGDQSSNFPHFSDCAPFDSDIHPRAKEIPHNGVDEDCDGLDEIVGEYSPLRQRATLKKKVRRDLVLITMDATRADHTGFMGYERDTTPNLDVFAEGASIFTRAYSQDSGTGPSLWSLMVGKTPFQVKLTDAHRFPPQIATTEITLAERLRKVGYDTVAIVCGDVFRKKKKKKTWNIRRGFRVFREVCHRYTKVQAEIVTAKVLNELRKLRRNKKPFFLWVHYLDPHHPYHQHPGDLFGKRKIDGYDEEIHYTDKEMGPLLESLSTGKRQPWVAITADHGENFGEHGTSPHARTLYRQVTHVPLIIRGPRLEGRQIEAPVASGDINPTFLELASIARPKDITMVSQASTVLGERVDEGRLVFQENSYARPRRDAKAIVGPRYHLIWDSTNDTYELFDLLKDPDEKKNLAGRGIPREAELRRILKNFAQSTHVPDNLAK